MNSEGPYLSGGCRRFSSVLAARPNNVRPSGKCGVNSLSQITTRVECSYLNLFTDLEVHLREHCQRLRVSEKLSGAHLVFPAESSLAVRAYYPADIAVIEASKSSTEDKFDDIDGIVQFGKQFRFSVVLFIGLQVHSGLNSIGSFPNRVQELLESHCDDLTVRVICVSSTQQAIAAITSVADAIRPCTSKLKQEFFQRQQEHILKNAQGPRAGFLEWSNQNGIQQPDAVLLTRCFPNLLTAASNDFHSLPCDPRTKLLLRSMFHHDYDDDMCAQDPLTSTTETFIQPLSAQPESWPSSYGNFLPPSHLSGPTMVTAHPIFPPAPKPTGLAIPHPSLTPSRHGTMEYGYHPSLSFPATVADQFGGHLSPVSNSFHSSQYQHQFS